MEILSFHIMESKAGIMGFDVAVLASVLGLVTDYPARATHINLSTGQFPHFSSYYLTSLVRSLCLGLLNLL